MKTQCPNCDSISLVSEQVVGRRAKCNACEQPFEIKPYVEPPPSPSPARRLPRKVPKTPTETEQSTRSNRNTRINPTVFQLLSLKGGPNGHIGDAVEYGRIYLSSAIFMQKLIMWCGAIATVIGFLLCVICMPLQYFTADQGLASPFATPLSIGLGLLLFGPSAIATGLLLMMTTSFMATVYTIERNTR